MERRIMKRGVTKGTREMGREERVTAKNNFSQRVKIGKGTGTVFGRRNREKINLVEERIKGERMERNRRRRGESGDLRIKMSIPSEFATGKADLVPQIERWERARRSTCKGF